MVRLCFLAIIILYLGGENSLSQDALTEDHISYRPATVAGKFYHSNIDSLNAEIERYLELDNPRRIPEQHKILGIVVPHAGYVYSGFVAGKIYRELIGKDIKTVIIISPSHQIYFNYSAVYPGDAYVTPLGPCKVDKELSKLIANQHPDVRFSMEGHSWRNVTPEHSIEVQIPFIQKVLPSAQIVPIVMGSQDEENIHSLSYAIVKALTSGNRKDDILLIASSDLSHYYEYKRAYSIDSKFLQTFSKFDYFKLDAELHSRDVEACGGGPIIAVMTVCESIGANKALSMFYATSGDSPYAPKNKEQVVGYFCGALMNIPDDQPSLLPVLTELDKDEITKMVKETVEKTIKNEKLETIEYQLVPKSLLEEYPVFITIESEDELRACMGHTFATKPLYFEIQDVARLSATHDTRFEPISPKELPKLNYSITILSKFIKIFDLTRIQVGKHGLYIRYRNRSGILLPQVASERNWDVNTFLEHLCLKAGIPQNTYLDPDAEIFAFEALIIH